MPNKIIEKIKENYLWPLDLLLRRCSKWIPSDRLYIQLHYFFCMHRFANLKHPRTFNEKLQWLKLHDKHSEYTLLVDKYEAKEFVRKILGDKVIIPTFGVWDNFDEIDFDALPNQFVLKTTHDSGGVVVCTDKATLDKGKSRKKLERSLRNNYYYMHREYPYKDVRPRIIAEKYLTERRSNNLQTNTSLNDYKFYCFSGNPTYCQVIRDRNRKETIDFYDMDWNHLPFCGLDSKAENGKVPVPRPIHFDKMIEMAKRLSKGMTFVRIDLYVVENKEYFGEITFFPASGIGTFRPKEWNNRLGELIELHIGDTSVDIKNNNWSDILRDKVTKVKEALRGG